MRSPTTRIRVRWEYESPPAYEAGGFLFVASSSTDYKIEFTCYSFYWRRGVFIMENKDFKYYACEIRRQISESSVGKHAIHNLSCQTFSFRAIPFVYEKEYAFICFWGVTEFCKKHKKVPALVRDFHMGDRRIELLTSSVSRKRSTSELTTLNAQHTE